MGWAWFDATGTPRWKAALPLKRTRIMKNLTSENYYGIKRIRKEFYTALAATCFLAILLGGVYPLIVWGLAQGLFPEKANGSLVLRNGRVVGSSLIGQAFTGADYFHPRPSAAGEGYDGVQSGGSNWGPTSRKLADTVQERVKRYREENGPAPDVSVPADAVTASASGLDPHITRENAFLQAHRVAVARGLNEEVVRRKIESATENRDLGFLGEPRVNVLLLNLALDGKL
jgi:potassium-transporting ATPase KdpC subunit